MSFYALICIYLPLRNVVLFFVLFSVFYLYFLFLREVVLILICFIRVNDPESVVSL